MAKEELPVVNLLLERQNHHPLLEGFPTAARIGDLRLFLGEAGAVQDAGFLEVNNIRAVIALGTGNLAVKQCEVLLIDILDMEEELLLPHFEECIAFLEKHLGQDNAVLVHCAYGQSRSAAICVAYLMATRGKALLEAYDMVQKARPCISINPGFLRQLELFQRMESNPEIQGRTLAHAELRTMMAQQHRLKTGVADIVTTPELTHPGNAICCRNCNHMLCTTRNQRLAFPCLQLSHTSPDVAAIRAPCAGIFIEPMNWMSKDSGFMRNNDGKLFCPSCKAKLGSWNWIGVNFSPVPDHGHCASSDIRTRPFGCSMGTAASSLSVGTLASKLPSILAVTRTINEQTLEQFKQAIQCKFHLNISELNALIIGIPMEAVEQAFNVFDPKNSGVVDSCEILSSLILAAPQLSRDTKQNVIFELFNVSTHRVGLMVADEATLLFRTVLVGAVKMLHALILPMNEEIPRLAFFENLTKALYGEQETLSCQTFAQLCEDTPEIDAFMVQWSFEQAVA